ncbi:MAG: hypothetical protein CM1200mP16_00980 [Nitrospina sp.]|nr:MAG: hypothetical protein CM1200mP16_00980 [Nitrospina sp.]
MGFCEQNLNAGYSEELIAVDINLAIEHLGAVLGKTFVEDLLDKIFGEFCIGKKLLYGLNV